MKKNNKIFKVFKSILVAIVLIITHFCLFIWGISFTELNHKKMILSKFIYGNGEYFEIKGRLKAVGYKPFLDRRYISIKCRRPSRTSLKGAQCSFAEVWSAIGKDYETLETELITNEIAEWTHEKVKIQRSREKYTQTFYINFSGKRLEEVHSYKDKEDRVSVLTDEWEFYSPFDVF